MAFRPFRSQAGTVVPIAQPLFRDPKIRTSLLPPALPPQLPLHLPAPPPPKMTKCPPPFFVQRQIYYHHQHFPMTTVVRTAVHIRQFGESHENSRNSKRNSVPRPPPPPPPFLTPPSFCQPLATLAKVVADQSKKKNKRNRECLPVPSSFTTAVKKHKVMHTLRKEGKDEEDEEEGEENETVIKHPRVEKKEKERTRRVVLNSHFETMQSIVRKYKRMTISKHHHFSAEQTKQRVSRTELMEDCIFVLQNLLDDNQKLCRDNVMLRGEVHLLRADKMRKQGCLLSTRSDSNRFVSI